MADEQLSCNIIVGFHPSNLFTCIECKEEAGRQRGRVV